MLTPSLTAAISTHALREEGDTTGQVQGIKAVTFLPTPSARRATQQGFGFVVGNVISTHALREEGDLPGLRRKTLHLQFLPTPSARRATRFRLRWSGRGRFLPTPSARRATIHIQKIK